MEVAMPELGIKIESAKVVPFSASPTLAFELHIENAQMEEQVHTIALRCQVQIEVTRRRYAPNEQERLRDLFGHPSRWGQTLRNLLWINTSVVVPGFEGQKTKVDLNLPCTFDFNIAATKYFEGLTEGEIPLLMLFSGTVFFATAETELRVAPISWELEARHKISVQLWREMMEIYYPNSAWINLRRDVFDQIHDYKVERGIPTWAQTFERMLADEAAVRR
jgi:hypothetical protein